MTQDPELHDFMHEIISKIPTKWKQLIIQIRRDVSDLERIEAGLSPGMHQCDTAFIEMFIQWIKARFFAFAWRTLITVLESPALNEKQAMVAHELNFGIIIHWFPFVK